jgi:TolB-like protein/tetratricopeptide (TPR) repeat protein
MIDPVEVAVLVLALSYLRKIVVLLAEAVVLYRFSEYLVDVDRQELRRAGEVVAVEPLVFDVLEFLIRNRGQIVSKDALIAGVWDGRIVSDSTLNSRMSAVRRAVGDTGGDQSVIRTVSRRGFQFMAAVEESQPGESAPAQQAAVAPRPRGIGIAVLGFTNLSPGTAKDCFVEGLVEEITTGLAGFPWLSVTARSSSAAYDGWAVDIRQMRRDLGVHYALEGSIRRTDARMRVSARLIDLTTATLIWAGGFDARHEDMLDLQDEIGAKVVAAVGTKLERVAITRVESRSGEIGSEAIEAYLRGLGCMYRWSKDGLGAALAQFERAIAIEHDFAAAYAMAAYCYIQRKSYGWFRDRSVETEACAGLARCAAELGANDAMVLARAAHAIASVGGDIDEGAVLVERACALDPHLAAAWYVSGWINLFLGKHELAIEHLSRAMQLGIHEPLAFKTQAALAYGYFFADRHDAAIAAARFALRTRPNYMTAMRIAAASQALAGRTEQARNLAVQMSGLDSTVCISRLHNLIPFRCAQSLAKWGDALRLAGLPG